MFYITNNLDKYNKNYCIMAWSLCTTPCSENSGVAFDTSKISVVSSLVVSLRMIRYNNLLAN
jgi:hypothetical protein